MTHRSVTNRQDFDALYEVTADGRVFSIDSNWRGYGRREMCQHLNSHGYPCVRLTVDGVRRQFRVSLPNICQNARLSDTKFGIWTATE